MAKKYLKPRIGFTLIELIITIGIIITLAALSITSLVRSKIIASESAAMESLKTLQTAFEYYRLVNNSHPQTFNDLCEANPPYLDSSWIGTDADAPPGILNSPAIKGYSFEIASSGNDNYRIVAHPAQFEGIAREFYITQNGEIFEGTGESLPAEPEPPGLPDEPPPPDGLPDEPPPPM
ncbi:MAG: hypothetical protein PHY46_04275 [Candidatus Omnitrophica bacterium]|nr:hypothetical protein [Candidatus Omnitrophota bacterium]MDD5355314.1 hypothetical protein [Candidatus Omnitrophota bacterium]